MIIDQGPFGVDPCQKPHSMEFCVIGVFRAGAGKMMQPPPEPQ